MRGIGSASTTSGWNMLPQKEGSAPPRLTRGLRAIAYDDPPIHSMIYIISPSHSRELILLQQAHITPSDPLPSVSNC